MTSTASYDVVIPSWNRSKLTLRALQSVASQDIKPSRVLVIDDGSDVHHRSIIRGGLSGPEELIETGGRTGASEARNLGIDRSTADHVLFLDSDDIWLPGHAETIISMLEGGVDVAISGSLTLLKASDDGIPFRTIVSPPLGRLRRRRLRPLTVNQALQMRAGLTATSCFGVRRSAFQRGIRFDSEIEVLEDLDLIIQALSAGLKVRPSSVVSVLRDGRGDDHLFQAERALNALDILAKRWATDILSCPRTTRRFILNRSRYACASKQPLLPSNQNPVLKPRGSPTVYMRFMVILQRLIGSSNLGAFLRIIQQIPGW